MGTINASQALLVAGTPISSASQWSANGSNVYRSAGNVGIAVEAPTMRFQVNSGGSSFVVSANGNVGIGDATPLVRLEVSSQDDTTIRNTVPTSGTADEDDLALWQSFLSGVAANYMWSNTNYTFGLARNGGANLTTQAEVLAVTDMVMDTNGNVGIGTTNPQATLHVSGNMRANTSRGQQGILIPAGGTYDIPIGHYGTLYVSAWNQASATQRTDRRYTVSGWSGTLAFTQDHTINGTTTSFAWSISNPSGFTARITNNHATAEMNLNYYFVGP